ncbi:choloylglycine hydrolase family protein [Cyanobium gracile]|uniref:Choloylglycine hydrolase family protein n=1 Tax=Cyanobium gracile UHCC 0281 TaxID=3110309 RepID=A0ABU5SRL8_9CYAN|nr:choloylglycine hydrolase family protein [Cyanobium gracile]MEA5441101.1 choloylglycine hydrolase family protein [Cyanobium gracile UHCC 0281]
MNTSPIAIALTLTSSVLLALAAGPSANACTGGALTAADGGVAVGRTLEFGKPLDSQIAVWPAGSRFTGSSNRGQGLSYRSRYGFLGATAAQYTDMILDGLNEKGLNVGLFYFPGFAQYTPEAKARQTRTLAPAQLGTWLLANFATVEEVKANLNSVDVTAQVISLLGEVPDVHFKVQDASGRSIVIEPREGRLLVHDNPTRVLTNAPSFPWHLTNLTNFLTVSSAYPPPSTLGAPGAGQIKLAPFGMGAGGFGLPGDFSPPSRFVRMVFFTQNASATPTARAAVANLFHILNNFDIPIGAARPPAGTAETSPDFTTWTSVSNLRDLTFNWKTFGDQRVKTIDLRQALGAANGRLKLLPMGPQQPDAVSPTLEVRVN